MIQCSNINPKDPIHEALNDTFYEHFRMEITSKPKIPLHLAVYLSWSLVGRISTERYYPRTCGWFKLQGGYGFSEWPKDTSLITVGSDSFGHGNSP